MTSKKNHIGSDFDDFLKEENIEINKEEIKEQIKELSKVHCNFKYSHITRNKALNEINRLKQLLKGSEDEK